MRVRSRVCIGNKEGRKGVVYFVLGERVRISFYRGVYI